MKTTYKITQRDGGKASKADKAKDSKAEKKPLDLKALLKSDKALKVIMFGGVSLIVLYFLSTMFESPKPQSASQEQPFMSGASVSEETRLEEKLYRAIIALDGVGGAESLTIVVTLEIDGDVRGAAVVAKGAADPVVRERIVEITSRLLGVGANRISVTH
ncbi:MAG: hypothetical protein FWD35_06895 [Oscillospiraceae bacterium]|nr:hypothetical protein [Oscillospiraceae bacterium]